jgi:hypothetical protein
MTTPRLATEYLSVNLTALLARTSIIMIFAGIEH